MNKSISIQEALQFRAWLQGEFTRRTRANPRYSLRAFSKKLDIEASSVSQILTGKRLPSRKMINRIEEELEQKFIFNNSSEFVTCDENYFLINQDMFSFISDWYHYAILDLLLLKNFKNDTDWIAKKLNISKTQVSIAIERMKRIGVLLEKKGKLAKSEAYLTNYSEGETSGALKEYQRQVIMKSLEAIDSCPQEKKDITSMTIAGNSKKIKKAKELIKKFRRDLTEFMEDGSGDHVFHLAVQLYPVTESTKDKL